MYDCRIFAASFLFFPFLALVQFNMEEKQTWRKMEIIFLKYSSEIAIIIQTTECGYIP